MPIKHANGIQPDVVQQMLNAADVHRYPERDRAMILLSPHAGLRAKEIASLTWRMVTDHEGWLMNNIVLPDHATKGKKGARTIPMHPWLLQALTPLEYATMHNRRPYHHVTLCCR